VLLLEYMIRMWDANDQVFHVGPHTLEIEMEDIYFSTGVSKWGAPIILVSHQSTEMLTNEYIAQYCREGTRKRSGNIIIKDIAYHPLHMILFTITKSTGNTWLHLS